jgi:hypothetical protein
VVSSRYLSVPLEGERDRWTSKGAKEGRRADQQITFVGEVEPPEEVADNLRLPEGRAGKTVGGLCGPHQFLLVWGRVGEPGVPAVEVGG